MLIWGRDPVIETPKPESGHWAWCPDCAGTGAIEIEGYEGMHEETVCGSCGGHGGWFTEVTNDS
jgi:DnaJ-class molecular chaperone